MFYGESRCQATTSKGNACTNLAYYYHTKDNFYSCGVHCGKPYRQELPKNPRADEVKQERNKQHMDTVRQQQIINQQQGKIGSLTLQKMFMMKQPQLYPGYLNVYPNYKDGGRQDGIGIPELSPKSLGPVYHKEPGLPPALNLENFHQGSKCFPDEIDSQGNPTKQFYQSQIAMFNDPKPHRHKSNAHNSNGNKNIPVYFVYNDGQEHHLDYITSRQFYCNYYQRLTQHLPQYRQLLEALKSGVNLCICGYDAFVPDQSLEHHYLDSSRAFGHELVLYTMLCYDLQLITELPWKKYQTFNF